MYFFRLNGVEFSFADVLFITSVLTICMIILVVTVCFCVTSTTTNHVRYVSSPFFLNFQNLVSHILADSDWQIRYFRKISQNENLSSLMTSSQENSKSFTTSWVRILYSACILLLSFFCNY